MPIIRSPKEILTLENRKSAFSEFSVAPDEERIYVYRERDSTKYISVLRFKTHAFTLYKVTSSEEWRIFHLRHDHVVKAKTSSVKKGKLGRRNVNPRQPVKQFMGKAVVASRLIS